MPKHLNTRSKELVANLIDYFEQERNNKGPLLPLNAVRERVANAMQLNLTTVSKISQTVKSDQILCGPKRKRPHPKTVCDINDFDKTAIRNVIFEMYETKQHITRQTLLEKLKERGLFHGGKTSLGNILKNMGFRWAKCDSGRGLMELPRIALTRIQFLRKFVTNLNLEHPFQVVFVGEMSIVEKGAARRSFQDNNKRSVKSTKVEEQRYVVLHAGNKNGFIPGASLIFSPKTNNADYFLTWFEDQLLKNLGEPSIIVIDNAPHHNNLVEVIPNKSWTKPEIRNWLQDRKIECSDDLLKVELLDLVSRNKPPKIFVTDQLAEKYGHQVLRVPQYHCIFNAMEHIWEITKGYYDKHGGRDDHGTKEALPAWNEALKTVTPQMWSDTVQHTEHVVQEWWEREVAFDREDAPPLIINLSYGSSSDSSSSDEEIL